MPTYTLNNVNYTYTVGTVAASVGTSASASGNVTLLSSFVVDGATYNVTSIAAMAFSSNTAITSVIIPESVTIINDGAFMYCNMLTSVTIPSLVTTIGPNAFNYSGLTSITIPASVTTIGASAFRNSPNLVNIVMNSSATIVNKFTNNTGLSITFDYVGVIPASV